MMAHGYACRAGRLQGVATVTQGPGLTNTATALTEAVRSDTPLLLDHRRHGAKQQNSTSRRWSKSHSSVQARSWLYRRRTAGGYRLGRSDRYGASAQRVPSIRPELSDGISIGMSSRRRRTTMVEIHGRGREERPLVPEEVIEEAVGVIASARRPLVLAGRGVADREQRQAILAFAERIPALDRHHATCTKPLQRGRGMCRRLRDGVDGAGCAGHWRERLHRRLRGKPARGPTVRNSLIQGKRVVHVDTNKARFRPECR